MDGTSKWSDECLRQQRILGSNALVGAWVCMHVYVYVYAHVYVYVCVRILGIHASVGAWVCVHVRSTIHMVRMRILGINALVDASGSTASGVRCVPCRLCGHVRQGEVREGKVRQGKGR